LGLDESNSDTSQTTGRKEIVFQSVCSIPDFKTPRNESDRDVDFISISERPC